MHSYYFVLQSDLLNGQPIEDRVRRIQEVAGAMGLECHTESHGDVFTLQVETEETDAAVAFKLAASTAIHEEH